MFGERGLAMLFPQHFCDHMGAKYRSRGIVATKAFGIDKHRIYVGLADLSMFKEEVKMALVNVICNIF